MKAEALERLRQFTKALNERHAVRMEPVDGRVIYALRDEFGIGDSYVDVGGAIYPPIGRGNVFEFIEGHCEEPSAVIVHSSLSGYTPSSYVLCIADGEPEGDAA